MNFFETLKEKRAGLPTWAWALVFVAILALYLKHKKSTGSAATQASTNAAAQQSASNLGSAANLANMFEVAGLMPYQGGDTFVNTTQTTTPAPTPTITPQPPKPPASDVPVRQFINAPKAPTSWTALAKQYNVFGGNGLALYWYNMMPNKHQALGNKYMRGNTTTTAKPGNYSIAIPITGQKINLPHIGVTET